MSQNAAIANASQPSNPPSFFKTVHNHYVLSVSLADLCPDPVSCWSPPDLFLTLQDSGNGLGAGRERPGSQRKFSARGYCQRAQGGDGPSALCFHGNIGGVMTASTVAPSAQDPVNDERTHRLERHLGAQASTTVTCL